MVGSVSPSRPGDHGSDSGSVSRRHGTSSGETGDNTGDRIDSALRRKAGRAAPTERLAASGVPRGLSLQVDGPVAHSAELSQRAWSGSGAALERLFQADTDASGLAAPSLPGALPEAAEAPAWAVLDESALAALDRALAPGWEGPSLRDLPRLGPRAAGAVVAGATAGLGPGPTRGQEVRALGPDLRLR